MTVPQQRELMAWTELNIEELTRLMKRLEPKAQTYQSDYVAVALEIMRWAG